MSPRSIRTTCCVAGGGPAGVMLGFLLARAGVEVTVLEKHADFFRAGIVGAAPFWRTPSTSWMLAPVLRRVGARVVGIGFRPERVETEDALAEASH